MLVPVTSMPTARLLVVGRAVMRLLPLAEVPVVAKVAEVPVLIAVMVVPAGIRPGLFGAVTVMPTTRLLIEDRPLRILLTPATGLLSVVLPVTTTAAAEGPENVTDGADV